MAKDFPRVQPVTYSFEGAKVRKMEHIAKAEHLKVTLETVVTNLEDQFKARLAKESGDPWRTMYYAEELYKIGASHKLHQYLLHVVRHIVSEQQKLNTEIIIDVTLEFLQHHVEQQFKYTSCTDRNVSGICDAFLVQAVREFCRGSSWDMGLWWRDAQRRDAEYQEWENEHYGHAAAESKKQSDAKVIAQAAAAEKAREARRAVKQKIKKFTSHEDWKQLTDEEVLAGWPLGSSPRIWEVRQVLTRIENKQNEERRAARQKEWDAQEAARKERDAKEAEERRINEVAAKS